MAGEKEVKTAEEAGEKLANMVFSFHSQLLKKGLPKEKADEMANNMLRGGNSTFDGQCG